MNKVQRMNTYEIIKKYWKKLFLLEFIYKCCLVVIIIPIISFSINLSLRCSKYSYVTADNLLNFIVYPPTILAVIFILILLAFFVQNETSALFYFYEDCKNHENPNVAQVMFAGVKSIGSLMKRKCYVLPFYSLCMAVFLNIPLLVIVISQSRIPAYIISAVLSESHLKVLIGILVAVLAIFLYRGIFTIPICILDKKSVKQASKESIEYRKGHNISMLIQLIKVNVILSLLYLVVYGVCCGILILVVYNFVDKDIAVSLFLKCYDVLNGCLILFISVVGFVFSYLTVSQMYVRASEPEIKEIVVETDNPNEITMHQIHLGKRFRPMNAYEGQAARHKRSINRRERLSANVRSKLKGGTIIMICLAGIMMYSYFYNTLHNGSFSIEESMLGIQISSHRGYSKVAPENTLPAIQAAIDNLSDYAEIDVQMTSDGEIVLMHDSTLYRTAGVRSKVSDLTYAELMTYDVGSWFSEEYEGTKIPTLAEVIELCKGKIKLNIEIKSSGNRTELSEGVVKLIEEYEFERQCVVTSTSYEVLKTVKECNSEIKTGLIMSIAYGNFYDNDNIDFFSMKSSIINESIVKKAHQLGKEVHAWTVNTRAEITRMESIGVDNIITDKPVYVQEVLYDNKKTSVYQYLKLMLAN